MIIRVGGILVALAAVLAANGQELSLRYGQPAAKWVEALPIGNGRLGGMIFGGTTNERVQFNEQTLWLGSETEMGSYQPFGDLFVVYNQNMLRSYSAQQQFSFESKQFLVKLVYSFQM